MQYPTIPNKEIAKATPCTKVATPLQQPPYFNTSRNASAV